MFRRRFLFKIIFLTCLMAFDPCISTFADTFFTGSVEVHALRGFFGELRGNYILPDAPLWEQVGDGLEIGFATSGKSIQQMPVIGPGLYFDSGGVYRDRFQDQAGVVVTPMGHVVAAGLLSVSCTWTDEKRKKADCGNGSLRLTIFVRDKYILPKIEPIFQFWAEKTKRNPKVTVIELRGYASDLVN